MLPFLRLHHLKGKWTTIDRAVLCFAIALLLNLATHFSVANCIEILGCFYLIFFYVFASRLLANGLDRGFVLKWGMLGNIGVCFLIGIIGCLLHLFINDHGYFRFYENYPYFGDTWRLIGLSSNNIIMTCLGMSILFIPFLKLRSIVEFPLIIFSIFICLLTYNKEIVVLIPLIVLVYFYNSKKKYIHDKLVGIFYIGLSLISIFFTFFAFHKSNFNYEQTPIYNPEQVNTVVEFSFLNFDFHGTTYFYLFKNSISAFFENPIFGIGFNGLKSYITSHRDEGSYPIDLKLYGSHDMYWGPAAELGLFYILFLFLLGFAFKQLLSIKANIDTITYNSLIAVFLFFGISYFISGSVQYRHLWVFLAIVNSYLLSNQQSSNQPKIAFAYQ